VLEPAWNPTCIPVDPGTKKPPGTFIQGRHYADFKYGEDYRAGWAGFETGHVTHPNVGVWSIDYEDVKDFKFALTNLGRVELEPGVTLAAMAQYVAAYRSAADPEHKLHIYIEDDEPPGQWATRAWPYDIKSNGFVRAEPAYLPTGVTPLKLSPQVLVKIEAAIAADRVLYRQMYPRIRQSSGARVTVEKLTWNDWHDDDGNPELNFTCDYDDALVIAGQLRNWYYDAEFEEAAAIFDYVMYEAQGYNGEPWSQTFEKQFWPTMEADHTERRDAEFNAAIAARRKDPQLPPEWVPTAAEAIQYANFAPVMGDRLHHYWAAETDPPEPTLLQCAGSPPIVRPGTLGSIYAEEKQAKTWTALAWAVMEALAYQRRVLYIDYENGPRRFAKRMRTLAQIDSTAARGSEAMQRLAFLQQQIKYMPDPQGEITDAELSGYDLIFIDAAIDFVDHHTDTTRGDGNSMNSAQAVNRVYKRLSAAARATGACIVLIDHANEKGDTSGSRRKRGALDWLARVEKQDDHTKVEWTFDRDSEETLLPAVYLVFDGYQLQASAPTPPIDGRLQTLSATGLSGDVLMARRQMIFEFAGMYGDDLTNKTALAKRLAGERGMSAKTWLNDIDEMLKNEWLVCDRSGVSMGGNAQPWMMDHYQTGKQRRSTLNALNTTPG
jgi:hypothetical protein